VVDSHGYLKLIDFGFAKYLGEFTTWTICGTPEYVAPEIITNQGHHLGVDWWALGVVLHEMLTGVPPFTGPTQMEVYQQVLRCNLKLPSEMSPDAKALIHQLLRVKSELRFGCRGRGAKDVMGHDFFVKLDWAALEARRLPPPFVPDISGPTDVSHFVAQAAPDDSMFDRNLDASHNDGWDTEFGAPIEQSEVDHLVSEQFAGAARR